MKNLALLVNISVATPSNPVRAALHDNGLIEFQGCPDIFRHAALRIFLNGAIVGTHADPPALYATLKTLKRKGILSPFTSIVWHVRENQMVICTEGGRFTRPVFVVQNQKLLVSEEVLERLSSKPDTVDWALDLILTGAVEYMDVEETNTAMIAMTPSDLTKPNAPSYTHCELSTNAMLGVVAGCIPFSDHNQAPRNTYQCLHPDEPVLLVPSGGAPTTKGLTKCIKDVVPGDRIITFCPKTYVEGVSFVTDVFVRPIAADKGQKMMAMSATGGTRTLRVTNDHRVMTSSGWRRVDQLIEKKSCVGVNHFPNIDHDVVRPMTTFSSSPPCPPLMTATEALTMLESMGVPSSTATSHVARMLQVKCLPLEASSAASVILAQIVGYMMSGQAKVVPKRSTSPTSPLSPLSPSSPSSAADHDQNQAALDGAVVIDILGDEDDDQIDAIDQSDEDEGDDVVTDTSDIENGGGAGGSAHSTTTRREPFLPRVFVKFDTKEDADAFEDDVERLGFPRVKVHPYNKDNDAVLEEAKRIVVGSEAVPMFMHVCAASSKSSVVVEDDGLRVIGSLRRIKERAKTSCWVVSHSGAFASLLVLATRASSHSKEEWKIPEDTTSNGFLPMWISKLSQNGVDQQQVRSGFSHGLLGGSITMPNKILNGLCGIRLLSKAKYNWRFSAMAALALEAVRFVTRDRTASAHLGKIIKPTPEMEAKGVSWLTGSGVHASRSLLFVPVEHVIPIPPYHAPTGSVSIHHTIQNVVDITVASDHHSFFGGNGGFAVSNSAMGKQAIGVYTSNFRHRFEPGHVLNYPQRPLVSTHTARLMHCDDLPCGMNVVVAIACYTGYNQEDSVIINKSAVDRGLFVSTLYRTIREQNSKNHSTGEEEFFCKPDPLTTRGIKPYNYDKLATSGFVPENTFVEAGDVIIGKCMPHKQISQNKDTSVTLKSNERGFVDKNCHGDRYFTNVTGDGYTFAKVRDFTENVVM